MEFGHLDDVSTVDFSLPADDPRSAVVLAGAPRDPFVVHAGPTGWSMKPWVGKVYPPGTKDADQLVQYGKAFNAVELNTTYYRVPDEATVARWRDAVPEGFRFFPKFPEGISRAEDLAAVAEDARRFADRMAGLGSRLGRTFLQLPPTFGPPRAGQLEALLGALPAGFQVAVEFRHPAWFSRGALVDRAFDLLASRGAVGVMTDVAGRRDVLHASIAAPAVFVRFIGNDLAPTDTTRLEAWADRIARWREAGLTEVAFFLHETDNVLAPEATNLFARSLNARLGPVLREWKPVPARQLGLF